MKKYLYLFLLGFTLSPLSVLADKVIVANCTEGGGCTFELSDFESDLFDKDFGRNIQPDDIVVLGKKKNGEAILYLDKKNREDIDKDWGGDGYTQISLFNPYLQPISGKWKVTYGASTGTDCYGIGNIGSFIRKTITPGMAGNGSLDFQYPFNPAQLFPNNDMRWVKTGYNTYKGILDFNSNSAGGMKMYYHVTLVDRKTIQTVFTIEVKVPTKETCYGRVPVNFELLAANSNEDPFSENSPEDDLLPVNPKEPGEDLLDVKPANDLLPVEAGKDAKVKPNVPRIDERTKPNVPRIEDKAKTNVPRLEDRPKPKVERIEN